MSYVVLARKYRPRSFEEMVGQDHVVQALTHALEQQRLHHAYLFTGTRGIGKTTVSRILAKSLNCTGPDGSGGITARPCGQCSACREIDADRYIDYVELDAASNRSIDEIRELIERAAYKPTVGRFKVFMIDEAHQLTKDAFNALLKTLEEPPEYLKFVLATTDPEKMLPTVLSRCLQFNLRPMAPQTVQAHLAGILAQEAVPAEAGALRLLARAARGSMRDGLSLTDQAIAFGGGQLEETAVRHMLGSVDRRHAERLVQALAERDGRAVLAECDALRGQGLSAQGTLEELARLLQQMAVEQAVPGAQDPTDPDTEAARRLAPVLAADETQLLYSICLQGRAELSLAPDEYAGLVMVLLRFLAFPAAGGAGARPGAAPASVAAAASGAAGPAAAATAGLASPAAAATPGAPSQPLAAAPSQPLAAVTLQPATAAPSSLPATAAAPRSPTLPLRAPQAARAAAAPPVAAAASPAAPPPPPRPGPGTAATVGRATPVAAAPEVQTRAARPPDDEVPPWMDEAPPWDLDEAQRATPADTVADPEDTGDGAGPRAAAEPRRAAGPTPAGRSAGPAANPGGAAVPGPAVAPAGPAAAQRRAEVCRVERTTLGDRWATLVATLVATGEIQALVRELAMQAELSAEQPLADGGGTVWRLTVERDTLRSAALSDKLLAALQGVAGVSGLRLDVVAGVAQDSPARRDAEQAALRQAEAERVIHDDPLVQSLLAQFSTARIVAGSIKPA